MLYSQYEQATGLFRVVRLEEGGRESILLEVRGYAGAKGPHRNNPASQHLRNLGPLPVGCYAFGKAETHPRLGPLAIPLIPHGRTDMLGRSGFLIHGDNARGDASRGCIILNRSTRRALLDLGVRHLEVVP